MSHVHVVHRATSHALPDGTNAALDVHCAPYTVGKPDFSENVMLGKKLFLVLLVCGYCFHFKKMQFIYQGSCVSIKH